MRPAVGLAARTLDGLAPEAMIAIAAAAGLDHVGLLVDAETTPERARAIARRAADAGVGILDLEVVRIHPEGPPADLDRTMDLAAAYGARAVLVIGHDADRGRTADAFRTVCLAAGARGLRAALEFMPFRGIATLDHAMEAVRRADHPAGAVLVDTQHLARSGSVPDDLRRLPAAWAPYVQLCDAPPVAAGDGSAEALMADALTMRTLPGEGGLPCRDVLRALPVGCPISVELIGRGVRDRFADDTAFARAIRRSVDALIDPA